MKGEVMNFNIKIVFVAMICALSIIGCNGTSKHFVKWPIKNIKEWPPKNVETDNLFVGVNVKNEELVFGPSWERISKEEVDMKNNKKLFNVYFEEINKEDPNSSCWYRYTICAGGMCVTRYLPPGCTP